MDFISELEKKVDKLINLLEKTKEENNKIKESVRKLEKEKADLNNQLKEVVKEASANKEKLDTAAEKVNKLIDKLKAIE